MSVHIRCVFECKGTPHDRRKKQGRIGEELLCWVNTGLGVGNPLFDRGSIDQSINRGSRPQTGFDRGIKRGK